MAQNPLLGSRISLISKKSIRYEGSLYSINESNATVALQNVRSYGTEGREKLDPTCTFVAPQDSVHPYLLFRGCDIKDLHVHENSAQQPPADPAILSSDGPAAAAPAPQQQQSAAAATTASSTQGAPKQPAAAQSEPTGSSKGEDNDHKKPTKQQQGGRGAGGNNDRRQKKPTHPAVGTGASLLNRKERGTVDGGNTENLSDEFDFQGKLKEFDKEHEEGDDEAGDMPTNQGNNSTYDKDDFFDSISCDVLDRQAGVDNRLRGAAERNLNTETFGAVALNSHRRRRRYNNGDGRGGGDGGRGGGGRSRGGGGRGRGGRGRGRGGRGRGQGSRGRSSGGGGGGGNNNRSSNVSNNAAVAATG